MQWSKEPNKSATWFVTSYTAFLRTQKITLWTFIPKKFKDVSWKANKVLISGNRGGIVQDKKGGKKRPKGRLQSALLRIHYNPHGRFYKSFFWHIFSPQILQILTEESSVRTTTCDKVPSLRLINKSESGCGSQIQQGKKNE